ncbi:hypothetical protein FAI41_04590 [Acetobacteraceae bacterium]|nr:hypothetical protein FAI41_04590 [Acetobacteraceae bacterium]
MHKIDTYTPTPSLSEAGFSVPDPQEILTGVQADLNQAFGGNLNPALNTPQGQLALSQTAILSDFSDAMLEIFNGIDPAFSSGRMQDALGRIYFLERLPATPTIVQVQITLTGSSLPFLKAGTVLATDAVSDGNLYATLEDLSFPEGTASPIIIDLASLSQGAIACPANSLLLYQGNIGIASLHNPSAGIIGKAAEGRIDFERRRAASVAHNAVGQNAALLGALLALEGVEDAQIIDNPENETQIIQGVSLPPHSLYAVLVGGAAADIGKVFLAKKAPGCATFGRQKITVTDENPLYTQNHPSYVFYFDYAMPQNLYITLVLANLENVPSNVETLISEAIMRYFKEAETRPKLGSTIYATDLICAIKITCPWARLLSLSLGLNPNECENEITLPLNQIAVTDEDFISLTLH